jgi:hypothetical protein
MRATLMKQAVMDECARLRESWSEFLWIHQWAHFATLTFRWACGMDAAHHAFLNRWVRSLTRAAQREVPYFFAIEVGRRGGRTHIHALVGGTERLSTRRISAAWTLGYSRVLVYDPTKGGARYLTKEILADPECYAVSSSRWAARRDGPSAPRIVPGPGIAREPAA